VNITIDNDEEYRIAGRSMYLFFICGASAAMSMVIMLLVGGVTWFAIAEAAIAAISLALGASFDVAREEYRFRTQHDEC